MNGDRTSYRLDEISAELDDELLWHASLGSKELFHSNILGWMAQTFPEEATQVFAPLEADPRASAAATKREAHHLDLIVQLPGFTPLVIENKMFSFPDDQQLIDYAEGPISALPKARLVLLSLMNPGWADGALPTANGTWHWLSYDTLAARIAEAFPVETGDYNRMTMYRYGGLLRLVLKLLDMTSIKSTNERVVPDWWANSAPEQSWILGITTKMRIHQLGNLIKIRLSEEGLPTEPVKTSFTHGNPLAEWFTFFDEHGEAGWQYQEGGWRLAMRFKTGPLLGREPAKRSAREDVARKHAAWFEFSDFARITGLANTPPPRSKEASDGFNHFLPDFVYRYRLLKSPTVEQILDLAAAYGHAGMAFRP